MDVRHTRTTASLSLCPSLWPFVRSSAGLINHTHAGAAAWIYRRGAGVEKGELTAGESRRFLKDQGAQSGGHAGPFGAWMDLRGETAGE